MQTCKKCHQAIFEGHAYELGDDRWHIQCFKCFKCDKALGCNSNFLVLGNGSLVCSSCSYNCKQCGKKIDDLAILTGDKAYCSNCFKCRVCKLKIEDLRYARTSKGLFCMACHEDLVAKKKKHDLKRKQKEQLLLLLRPAQAPSSSGLAAASLSASTSALTQQTASSATTPASVSASAASSLTLLSSHAPLSQSHAAANAPAASAGTAGPGSGSGSLSSSSPGMTLSPAPEMFQSKPAPKPPLVSKLSAASVPSATSTSGAGSITLLPAPIATPSLMPSLSVRSPGDHETISVDSYATFESPGPKMEPSEQLETTDAPQEESHGQPKTRKRLERHFTKSLAADDGAILDLIDSFSEPTTPVTSQPPAAKAETQEATEKNPLRSSGLASGTLAPSAVVSPRPETKDAKANGLGSGDLESSLPIPVISPSKTSSYADVYPNKNIMIISPNQFHDSEFHSADLVGANSNTNNSTHSNNSNNNTLQVNDDSIRPRSSVSSPMAKVNRQARVVETTDENSAVEQKDSSPFYLQSAVTTPKKNQALAGPITSPPPLLALPQIPTTPGARGLGSAAAVERAELYEPKGLGLKGLELKGLELHKPTHTVKEATPAVSNLEDTISAESPEGEKPSRTKSTRSKLLLRHKRSVSGGLTSGSLSSRLGFFKLKDESEKNGNGGAGERGHSRHVLEGSINGQAFTTPPLPFSSPFRQSVYRELHSRSASDTHTPFMNEGDLDFDVGMLKAEISSLDSRRQALLADNMRLNSDRSRLKETLVQLELKVTSEVERLEAVRREISELSATQQRLKEENDSLVERNRELEAQNLASQANANQASQTSLSTAHLGALGLAPHSSNQNHRASQFYDAHSDHIDNMNALDSVSEDVAETQKATRLKFWRRPKVSITLTGFNQTIGHPTNPIGPSGNGNSGNGSSALTKMSLSFSSNSLHPSGQSTSSDASEGGGAFKSFNSLITKSRSTNLLESFVNSASGSNNNNGGGNGDAHLFSSTIQRRAVFEGQKVPLIVSRCLEEVEKRGMDVEGIYRLSGGNSAIAAIENAFASASATADRKQLNKITELLSGDINAVTSALKRYLRKLPDPLIPFALYSSFTKVGQSKSDTSERCQELVTRVILRLPAANKHALYLIGKHLDKVNYYSSVNRMNFKNLSVVFAPTIARDSTGEREIMDMGARNEATELLFANFSTIFANYNE